MEVRIKAINRERNRVFALGIGYFLLILACGSWIFFRDASYANVLVVGCVAVYLLLVRPVLNRYRMLLRRSFLEIHLGSRMKNLRYDSRGGMAVEVLERSDLVPVPMQSFLSRELVTGKSGSFSVTLADVTFPIRMDSRNQMFSGCAICIEAPQGSFRPLRVEADNIISGVVSQKEQSLLEEIGSLIPGSLYVSAQDRCLFVILRGRFLGWRINPLMEVTKNTLSFDPMPEFKGVLDLAKALYQ